MKVLNFLHARFSIHNNGIFISHGALHLQKGFMVVPYVYKGVF